MITIVPRWRRKSAGGSTKDKIERIFRAIEAHEGRWSILTVVKNDHLYGGYLGNLLHITD